MIFDLELFNNLWMLNVFKIKKKMSNIDVIAERPKKSMVIVMVYTVAKLLSS